MRKSWIQLYAPFIVLALIQALFVAVAPSRGGGGGTDLTQFAGGGGGGAGGAAGGDVGTGDGSFASGDTSGIGGTGSTDGTGGASGTGGTGGSGGTGSGPGGNLDTGGLPGTGGGKDGPAADTSHCKGPLQHTVLINANPPCKPKFAGNNGGATYQGVTDKTIKVVIFSSKPNEQVDAILARQGLAVPREEFVDFVKTGFAFIEKNYEMYGRKFDLQFIIGDCPTTPPNYDKCNAEAQAVVKQKPFMVIWNTPLYASVFDIWAKAGIIAMGGWQFEASFFNQRRPFRYDPWMNGTELGAHVSEYFCKKLAKKNVSHSGEVIHPTIGRRGTVVRKLGIVTPEIEANVLAAKRVASAVAACGGGNVPIYTYESDIERATQQTQATVQGLIDQKVTTVTCMCDPIAPAFLTAGMTGNNFFPEFLIPGQSFMDSDLVGRLYDARQMSHAFGIGLIPSPVSLAEADPTRMWRAMSKQGVPCGKSNCGTMWPYINMVGWGIHLAGPNLNPLTFENALLKGPAAGGFAQAKNPTIGLWKLGGNDYTWLSDVREFYWDANATSKVDGERGAYVDLNGGRRYVTGEWTGDFAGVPVRP